jgi:hypothetical protein
MTNIGMTMQTESCGTKRWYNENRLLHRDNGLPAIEHADGTKRWIINGQNHRDNDLPAIEYADGGKWWFVNGKLHRGNDLPAIIQEDGTKSWYVNYKLHRLGGLPAVENVVDGNKKWYIYDKEYTYKQVINYYKIFKNFGRYCLRKIRMRRLRRLRWIHGELLCMPAKGSYLGGQDYHKMISYFMSM